MSKQRGFWSAKLVNLLLPTIILTSACGEREYLTTRGSKANGVDSRSESSSLEFAAVPSNYRLYLNGAVAAEAVLSREQAWLDCLNHVVKLNSKDYVRCDYSPSGNFASRDVIPMFFPNYKPGSGEVLQNWSYSRALDDCKMKVAGWYLTSAPSGTCEYGQAQNPGWGAELFLGTKNPFYDESIKFRYDLVKIDPSKNGTYSIFLNGKFAASVVTSMESARNDCRNHALNIDSDKVVRCEFTIHRTNNPIVIFQPHYTLYKGGSSTDVGDISFDGAKSDCASHLKKSANGTSEFSACTFGSLLKLTRPSAILPDAAEFIQLGLVSANFGEVLYRVQN